MDNWLAKTRSNLLLSIERTVRGSYKIANKTVIRRTIFKFRGSLSVSKKGSWGGGGGRGRRRWSLTGVKYNKEVKNTKNKQDKCVEWKEFDLTFYRLCTDLVSIWKLICLLDFFGFTWILWKIPFRRETCRFWPNLLSGRFSVFSLGVVEHIYNN